MGKWKEEKEKEKSSIGDQLDCKNSLWESKIKLQWFLFLYIEKKKVICVL